MSDTPRTDAMRANWPITTEPLLIEPANKLWKKLGQATSLCELLERELAAYQQAEMPDEPGGPNQFEEEADYISAHFAYARALRIYAARATVDRNEAKENARTLNTTLSANIREFERMEDALSVAKEAQARAESALADANKSVIFNIEERAHYKQCAEIATRKLAECEKWRELAFQAHSNIDLDIEAISKESGNE